MLALAAHCPPPRPARSHPASPPHSTSLDGAAESKGDLKSVVLHDMAITHAKSSFPLGAHASSSDPYTHATHTHSTVVSKDVANALLHCLTSGCGWKS